MNTLNIYHVALIGENLLGPGKRIGIWLQGCEHGCPGCIVPESWDVLKQRYLYTPEDMLALIEEFLAKYPDILGMTISGGEPFLQSIQLLKLIQLVRSGYPRLDMLCFSGFLFEDLLKVSDYAELLRHIDILIDGLYMQELNQNQMWRGSENQRIILLSDRYNEDTFAKIKDHKFRKIEVLFTGSSYTLVGIPPKDLGADFESLL